MNRKYALTKLGAGDYLCPSNDGSTVWRFQTYHDGHAFGLDVPYECRTFWMASSIDYDKARDQIDRGVEINDLEWWDDVYRHLPSRSQALETVFGD